MATKPRNRKLAYVPSAEYLLREQAETYGIKLSHQQAKSWILRFGENSQNAMARLAALARDED